MFSKYFSVILLSLTLGLLAGCSEAPKFDFTTSETAKESFEQAYKQLSKKDKVAFAATIEGLYADYGIGYYSYLNNKTAKQLINESKDKYQKHLSKVEAAFKANPELYKNSELFMKEYF